MKSFRSPVASGTRKSKATSSRRARVRAIDGMCLKMVLARIESDVDSDAALTRAPDSQDKRICIYRTDYKFEIEPKFAILFKCWI